ncbi:hemin uptake protein HemP [Janthinobacterium sp. 17J80-10]|uniref:hemin uptake protein HemP n=1 Tax=Janthinobacterium sp. 17J80-10 TaxID=2497863 RepID=UPI0010058220|nr:hemin uptake protein HemP [Janthinobacterium sp. 17J80-10]QAU35657.1 hemin uptake protein HemP [Janthinobacterium sp. 17J80-10]
MDSVVDPFKQQQTASPAPAPAGATGTTVRLQSRDLFAHAREVEIDHGGRIYKLRLTQQNKLILTA